MNVSGFSTLTPPPAKDRVVIVDVETTGLSVQRGGRVIEIGALVLESGVIVDEFGTLINTGASISHGAYLIHGISDDMLAGQPEPKDVWWEFRNFAGHDHLVAHNASFDSSFVLHELSRLGLALPNPWHCTLRLARKMLPNLMNHRLDTVYQHLFGSIPDGIVRHRSLDDARLTAQVWIELSKE